MTEVNVSAAKTELKKGLKAKDLDSLGAILYKAAKGLGLGKTGKALAAHVATLGGDDEGDDKETYLDEKLYGLAEKAAKKPTEAAFVKLGRLVTEAVGHEIEEADDEEEDEKPARGAKKKAAPKRAAKKAAPKKGAAKKTAAKDEETEDDEVKVKMLDKSIAVVVPGGKKGTVTLKLKNGKKKVFSDEEFEEKEGRGFDYIQIEPEEEEEVVGVKMLDKSIATMVEGGKKGTVNLKLKNGKVKNFPDDQFEEKSGRGFSYVQVEAEEEEEEEKPARGKKAKAGKKGGKAKKGKKAAAKDDADDWDD